jgi:hypothetical protein
MQIPDNRDRLMQVQLQFQGTHRESYQVLNVLRVHSIREHDYAPKAILEILQSPCQLCANDIRLHNTGYNCRQVRNKYPSPFISMEFKNFKNRSKSLPVHLEQMIFFF